MGPDTHLNQRRIKLASKGLTDEQIARKIGRPDAAGLRRVRKVTAPNNWDRAIRQSIETAERKQDV